MGHVETYWTRLAGLAVAALIAVTAACGDESPSDVDVDPTMAAVNAAVHDSASVLPPGRASAPPADSTDYAGEATGTARVEIFSEAGGWASLGEGTDLSFQIYCLEAGVVVTNAEVDPDTYTMVRLTLTDFQASIGAGAVIEATTYGDPFVVAFGSGDPVVIEKSVAPFTLAEGSATTILFDLNTELWLDDLVVGEGVVSAAEVQSATNVIIR